MQTCALDSQLMGLPWWTIHQLLALPHSLGGQGGPNLPMQAAAHILATYTHAMRFYNLLARCNEVYLTSSNALRHPIW